MIRYWFSGLFRNFILNSKLRRRILVVILQNKEPTLLQTSAHVDYYVAQVPFPKFWNISFSENG